MVGGSSVALCDGTSAGAGKDFGEDLAGLSPYNYSAGGPEVVGGSSSTTRVNVALTAGGDKDLAGLDPFIGGPETVGGSSSTTCFDAALYSESATAGGDEWCIYGEEFLCDCFSQVDSLMHKGNADRRRKKWNLFLNVFRFTRRLALAVNSPMRKKQRVVAD